MKIRLLYALIDVDLVGKFAEVVQFWPLLVHTQ